MSLDTGILSVLGLMFTGAIVLMFRWRVTITDRNPRTGHNLHCDCGECSRWYAEQALKGKR